MIATVFGGPEDGKRIKVPDDARSWVFNQIKPEVSWADKTSPFAPTSENSTPETWRILLKRKYDSTEEYLVIVAPRLDSWLRENFATGEEEG